jgi:hypothetical protein
MINIDEFTKKVFNSSNKGRKLLQSISPLKFVGQTICEVSAKRRMSFDTLITNLKFWIVKNHF